MFLAKDNHGKHYALKRVLTHDDEELLHVQQEIAVMVFPFYVYLCFFYLQLLRWITYHIKLNLHK